MLTSPTSNIAILVVSGCFSSRKANWQNELIVLAHRSTINL